MEINYYDKEMKMYVKIQLKSAFSNNSKDAD